MQLNVLLYLFVALNIGAAQAQTDVQSEQPAPVPEQPTKQVEAAEQTTPATPNTNNSKKIPDTFIPTEDISEDLSVSYPVDI